MIALGAAAPAADAPWAGWDYHGAPSDHDGDQRPDAQLCRRHATTGWTPASACSGRCATPSTPARRFCTWASSPAAWGALSPAEHMPPAELPDDEYPLMLTTGRVLYHWHGAEMTRRARGLNASLSGGADRDQSEGRAARRRRQRRDGQAQLAPRRDRRQGRGNTDASAPGLVFATFHFPESAANFLTNPALDPVAKIPEFKVCAVKLERSPA